MSDDTIDPSRVVCGVLEEALKAASTTLHGIKVVGVALHPEGTEFRVQGSILVKDRAVVPEVDVAGEVELAEHDPHYPSPNERTVLVLNSGDE